MTNSIIDSSAKIDKSVKIGPFCVIGPDVEINENTIIHSHVNIMGNTEIGKNNKIYHYCSLGEVPQDKKFTNEKAFLKIGDNNTIREFCTFNIGTSGGGGITEIGNNNWLMAYVHIAHDCKLGNEIVLANNSSLAGHVEIDDFAILGYRNSITNRAPFGNHENNS